MEVYADSVDLRLTSTENDLYTWTSVQPCLRIIWSYLRRALHPNHSIPFIAIGLKLTSIVFLYRRWGGYFIEHHMNVLRNACISIRHASHKLSPCENPNYLYQPNVANYQRNIWCAYDSIDGMKKFCGQEVHVTNQLYYTGNPYINYYSYLNCIEGWKCMT